MIPYGCGLGLSALLGILGAGGIFDFPIQAKAIVNSPDAIKGKIVVADSCPLGNRQFLVVAQYGLEKHLLGVSQGQVSHLAKLDPESELKVNSDAFHGFQEDRLNDEKVFGFPFISVIVFSFYCAEEWLIVSMAKRPERVRQV